MSIEETDERLLWLLRRAGDEWGPAGVAKVAVELAQPPALPLYVNHPRAEPVSGDVVRDADGVTWLHDSWKTWHSADSTCEERSRETGLEQPLTLLVDGETGQVVP